ncbi:dTMP kinase [Streptomyces sp. NPDC057521]|uniref:dTMP kinase n=1 Tax=Streptomyces sp. NPDC057521 TaxID=3346156 RepID=UPI00367DA081
MHTEMDGQANGSIDLRGRLIALEGIDGSGKSTLARSLYDRLNATGVSAVLVSKTTTQVDGEPDLTEYLEQVNTAVYRRKATVGQACGDAYWLFALAAWYSLQDELVIRPALRDGKCVIMDNAYYKIIARYAVGQGLSMPLITSVFSQLTKPDAVLLLSLSSQEALRRKGDFTLLEAGRSGTAAQDFVDYQDSVAQALRDLVEDSWSVLDVAGKEAADVLDEATACVEASFSVGEPAGSAGLR